MSPSGNSCGALEADWLAVCVRAADAVARALETFPASADRRRTEGRGEGGDMTLEIDRAAEDEIFRELQALELPLTAVSEERGRVEIHGGGPTTVVIDPIDGSLNAKRCLPFYGVSIAVASGPTMADVEFGYVRDLPAGDDWSAARGRGATLNGAALEALEDGERIEALGLETARPERVAAAVEWIARSEAERVRALGSVALSLCAVAGGRLDAMASLRACRSVDAAAAQLIVREAGGAVDFVDAGDRPLGASLSLDMRSRVFAATGANRLRRLVEAAV